MTKTVNVADSSNPIIVALAAFYAIYGETNANTGQSRQPDARIQSLLNFGANSFYRNLYEPIQTRNGAMDNLKEAMDKSQANLHRIIDTYRAGGREDDLQSAPEALLAAIRAAEDEARFEFARTVQSWFADAFQHHTGKEWRYEGPTASLPAGSQSVAKEQLGRFLSSIKKPNDTPASETLKNVAA